MSLAFSRMLLVSLGVSLVGCDVIATQLGAGPSFVVVEDARGLAQGDPVRVHGVTVGRVGEVSVVEEGARIELELTSAIALHADACAVVRAEGLVGEAYLHLDPGEAEAPLEAPLAACNEPTMEGATAASLAELTGLIEDLRRYVGTLERGERTLCHVAGAPTSAPDTVSEPHAEPAPAPEPAPGPEPHAPGPTDTGAE